MGEQLNKHAFHKHLLIMDCRKDIIIQNDFINKRIKDRNISFFSKYSQKTKNNKMRLIYLAGFCVFFSLDPIYNAIFDSKLYHKMSSFIFDRSYLSALSELESPKIKYSSNKQRQLGQYFLNFEKHHSQQQIKASLLSNRIAEFSNLGDSIIDCLYFQRVDCAIVTAILSQKNDIDQSKLYLCSQRGLLLPVETMQNYNFLCFTLGFIAKTDCLQKIYKGQNNSRLKSNVLLCSSVDLIFLQFLFTKKSLTLSPFSIVSLFAYLSFNISSLCLLRNSRIVIESQQISFFFFLSQTLHFTFMGTLLIVVSGAMLILLSGFFSIIVFNRFDSAVFFFLIICLFGYFLFVFVFQSVKRSILRSSQGCQGEMAFLLIEGSSYFGCNFYSDQKSVFLKKLLELII